MIEIKPYNIKDRCEVAVPGSKSVTHRILIASALSDGVCRIENALLSEDTVLTMKALRQMGIRIEEKNDNLRHQRDSSAERGTCLSWKFRYLDPAVNGCCRPGEKCLYPSGK